MWESTAIIGYYSKGGVNLLREVDLPTVNRLISKWPFEMVENLPGFFQKTDFDNPKAFGYLLMDWHTYWSQKWRCKAFQDAIRIFTTNGDFAIVFTLKSQVKQTMAAYGDLVYRNERTYFAYNSYVCLLAKSGKFTSKGPSSNEIVSIKALEEEIEECEATVEYYEEAAADFELFKYSKDANLQSKYERVLKKLDWAQDNLDSKREWLKNRTQLEEDKVYLDNQNEYFEYDNDYKGKCSGRKSRIPGSVPLVAIYKDSECSELDYEYERTNNE